MGKSVLQKWDTLSFMGHQTFAKSPHYSYAMIKEAFANYDESV